MGAALNDLAYAVNDTIKDPANFKALNVLIQEMINNAVSQALNNTFGTEGASPLNVLIGKGNADIKNAITALANGGGVPIVRKIQRGKGSIAKKNKSATVTLSGFTNSSKMFAIVNGTAQEETDFTNAIYVSSLSKTSLAVEVQFTAFHEMFFSYQVIELW